MEASFSGTGHLLLGAFTCTFIFVDEIKKYQYENNQIILRVQGYQMKFVPEVSRRVNYQTDGKVNQSISYQKFG